MHLKSSLLAAVAVPGVASLPVSASDRVISDLNYEAFMSRHDMVWDRLPNRGELAPYTGNGNVGFLFYQAMGGPKNVISIHTGRHDYYDHRLPVGKDEMLWIYRSRLPIGHFNLNSIGDVTGVDLRLGLWNAELTGTIKTAKGSYAVRGLTHSTTDIIYVETLAEDGESIKITWHPDVPLAPVKQTLDAGGGPKGSSWDKMRTAPYEMPPQPTLSKEDGMEFCLQPLHENRGETTTAWEVTGNPAGRQLLTASVHHSFPAPDACLGDGEQAYPYLDFLIQRKNVSPTTMYAEGNPVIETPLSFATSIHDMLLQSWGGKIRVFHGTPKRWADAAFKDLRTQGAFLVSAKKKAGVTQFVTVESLVGSPWLVQVDIPNPKTYINGVAATKAQAHRNDQGLYEIMLAKGETATFTPVALEEADLKIEPIPVGEVDCNLYGLSKKTERLPGHAFY